MKTVHTAKQAVTFRRFWVKEPRLSEIQKAENRYLYRSTYTACSTDGEV